MGALASCLSPSQFRETVGVGPGEGGGGPCAVSCRALPGRPATGLVGCVPESGHNNPASEKCGQVVQGKGGYRRSQPTSEAGSPILGCTIWNTEVPPLSGCAPLWDAIQAADL